MTCLIACGNEGQDRSPWQLSTDDRLRAILRFGPPDKIESVTGVDTRPIQEGGGEADTFPYEDWHYHHLDGIGEEDIDLEFVDDCLCSDYRLRPTPTNAAIRGEISKEE